MDLIHKKLLQKDELKNIGFKVRMIGIQRDIFDALEKSRGKSGFLYRMLTQRVESINPLYIQISDQLPSLKEKYTNNIDGLYERYAQIGMLIRTIDTCSKTRETLTRQFLGNRHMFDRDPYWSYKTQPLPQHLILSAPEITNILFRESEDPDGYTMIGPMI